MGKTAFLFSGQGAQHSGMGKELYENYAAVRVLFDAAEEYRPGTLHQMFEGSEETLQRTENTQPCLYLADLAAALALRESGVLPEAAAGFSLGELPALAFAGACDAVTGFRLACARGSYMAAASAQFDATMAAVVRLSDETVERLCAAYSHVYPVNYNCEGQVAVAGDRTELQQFCQDVAAAGGRSVPLKVSSGFHSPFMDEAARQFHAYISNIPFRTPEITVYSNRTAMPYGQDVRTLLFEQINHPVRWAKIMQELHAQGFDTFIECGAGSVLRRLATKNLPGCRAFAVEDLSGISKLREEGIL